MNWVFAVIGHHRHYDCQTLIGVYTSYWRAHGARQAACEKQPGHWREVEVRRIIVDDVD